MRERGGRGEGPCRGEREREGEGEGDRVQKVPRVETEEGEIGYGEVLFKQEGIVMSLS